MAEKNKDILISDSGVVSSNKRLHVSIFVHLCRILSAALAVLGILAFIEGNFR